ncbi:hypothetical protein [Campylobacter concisus]|uniref:hypothetical protein n=1 Tax=Campylobacter concisus TaxID=199 RepID=UPI001F345CCE|nr:hypothetical protein [Campylobacter concisus]
MKQLAIIIFLITSLYSHETNCTDMFGLIFNKNLSDAETTKYIKYYIDDLGCNANASINLPNFTMKASLLEFAYSANKPKSIDEILEKGAVPNVWLAGSIGLDFLLFFEENGVKLEGQSPSPQLFEFIKTQKYKEFKEEKFKLIKKLLEHGQDPRGYILLQKVLTLINDEKDLLKLLKKENK